MCSFCEDGCRQGVDEPLWERGACRFVPASLGPSLVAVVYAACASRCLFKCTRAAPLSTKPAAALGVSAQTCSASSRLPAALPTLPRSRARCVWVAARASAQVCCAAMRMQPSKHASATSVAPAAAPCFLLHFLSDRSAAYRRLSLDCVAPPVVVNDSLAPTLAPAPPPAPPAAVGTGVVAAADAPAPAAGVTPHKRGCGPRPSCKRACCWQCGACKGTLVWLGEGLLCDWWFYHLCVRPHNMCMAARCGSAASDARCGTVGAAASVTNWECMAGGSTLVLCKVLFQKLLLLL